MCLLGLLRVFNINIINKDNKNNRLQSTPNEIPHTENLRVLGVFTLVFLVGFTQGRREAIIPRK